MSEVRFEGRVAIVTGAIAISAGGGWAKIDDLAEAKPCRNAMETVALGKVASS